MVLGDQNPQILLHMNKITRKYSQKPSFGNAIYWD